MSAVVVAALDVAASDLKGPLFCSVAVPAGFPSLRRTIFRAGLT